MNIGKLSVLSTLFFYKLKTAKKKKNSIGNSLVVRWLGLCAFAAEDPGSIPGRGTKVLQAVWCVQKKKKKSVDLKCKSLFLNFQFYSVDLYVSSLWQYHTVLITVAL